MATLNITYNGLSADFTLQSIQGLSDGDVKRIAVEALRSGGTNTLRIGDLPLNAFDNYVVDRFRSAESGEDRIYLRPKVPFG